MRTYTDLMIWRFDAPPERIWPALADTKRFNEAAGLPKHGIEEIEQADGSIRYFAEARRGPLRLRWEEIPVEWVDGRWFRHLRRFENGPLKSLCATLTLRPEGAGGTYGEYLVEVEPANLFGLFLVRTGFFPVIRRLFGALARGAGDWAGGRSERPYPAKGIRPSGRATARISGMTTRIDRASGGNLAQRLADEVLDGQETDLAHMRPRTFARAWGADPEAVIETCLQSVVAGLLSSQWDLLCPRCRGAKATVVALDKLPVESHCRACNIDYARDFDRNVELTFRPHPAVREIGEGEYCLFGPMSTPHVKVQAALAQNSERTLIARLAPGPYRLRTLEIGGASDIDYPGGPFPAAVAESGAVVPGPPGDVGEIRLVNDEPRPRTLIIESREWARDALTAHEITTRQGFRDLFPDQILGPGDETAIQRVALLFTDLKGSTRLYERAGDGNAYQLVRSHFAYLGAIVRRHRGAVVKTIGDAVLAAFAEPIDGIAAGLAIQDEIDAFNDAQPGPPIVIKAGLHAGPCLAVTLNGRIDYFGRTVNLAARLQDRSEGGDLVLSEELATDPAAAPLLAGRALEWHVAELRGITDPVRFARLRADVAGH